GASVQLDIQTQQLPEFDLLSWMNDKLESIVRYNSDSKIVKLHNPYKDRVDFNDTTFSLTLKNMQKTDSGLYTARISGLINKDFVAYRISVIDAVAAPALTVNSNCDSCTVNFTCRAHELTIYSSYQNNSCSPEEVTLQQNYTLILFCSEETIICNHSNPVSWKENRSNITQLCTETMKTDSFLLWSVVGSVPVCILIICIIVFMNCKCKKAQTEDETGDNRPNTTYCTVGQYQEQKIPPETEKTIYSVVKKKTNKKPPAISSDDT
uniref:Immunoglobulin V-set domain-containing protein n=1 Tax=Sinocyclocheilus anshuiensis TaxID=1608454 RepID=A0A671R6Y9_9TELE